MSGSDLYAGGQFTTAGGIAANYIAKWNGSNWTAVGSGTDGAVHSLAVSGSDVYAGGIFRSAGGSAANLIAKYIDRYRWIGWIGLAVILWVAGKMIYDGFVDHEVGVLRYLWPDLTARLTD